MDDDHQVPEGDLSTFEDTIPPPVLPSENKTSGDKKRKKKEKKTPHLPETVTPDEPKVDKPSENFPKAASEDSKAILEPRIPKAGDDTGDDGQEKIMDKKGKRKQKNKERKIKNKTQRKEKAMEIQKIKIRKINEVKKAIGMSMPRTIVMKKSQKIKVTKKSVELSMLKAMLIEAMQPKHLEHFLTSPLKLLKRQKTYWQLLERQKHLVTSLKLLKETVTPDEPKVDKPSENFPKAASEDSKAILKPRIPKAGGDTDDDGQEKIMDKKGKRKQKAQRKQKVGIEKGENSTDN
ncbi:hypothetical protein GCK72_008970 [Caenorhabditis remanei]|uniref:Uncharacterized protein n=1 Tax=Caenorhabditis remanei TaxID=31234 RepID=A0A6A5H133_CAERE|nr:hypothetical protein GCK72_008970 [Caenorhabditis remanei]KAF1760721.1 hypothetical protein GCK72_008970 [Caenorhabditis remanei]